MIILLPIKIKIYNIYNMPTDPSYSIFLTDPSNNTCIIFQNPLDSSGSDWSKWLSLDIKDRPTKVPPLYGISGHPYTIVYDNSMTYIGYDPSMSFFNASGEVLYLTGINSEASMNEIVSRRNK
jgi:hypothetical protein